MKIIFRLVPVTFFKIIVLSGIVLLLSQCVFGSREIQKLRHRYMEQIAETQANYWEGLLNRYIHILHTLADIMANYEDMPAENRREYYDRMLFSLILSDADILILETVWKPNAIDGRDSRIGPYNTVFRRSYNSVENLVSATDIDTATAYLNGPNSRKDRVDTPNRTVYGEGTYLIRMTVPVVNLKTDEVVGCVSLYLKMDMIQKILEQTIITEYYYTFMMLYSNDGLIMGSFIPDHVGRKMTDVENIFGSYARDAERAVLEGMDFYLSTYSAVMKEDVEIFMMPVFIGNSDTPWSILVVVPKSFLKQRGFGLW